MLWPSGVLIGSGIGQLLPAPETIGLDAIFPAILLALVLPALKKKTTLIRAGWLTGSVVAAWLTDEEEINGHYRANYRWYRGIVGRDIPDALRRRKAWQ